MSDCLHEWKEVYYGTECTKCVLFYPEGLAPWEYVDEDVCPPDVMASVFDPYLGDEE